MQSIVQNYGKRCLPGAYRFYTVQELNKLLADKSLTESDLNNIYHLRESYYRMQEDRVAINAVSSTHNNEPSTIIFLDIKGTLYEGGTHDNGSGLLSRSRLDSKPITYDEIDAFGDLIVRTMPQDLHQFYTLNGGYKIEPTKLAYDQFLVKRPHTRFDEVGHFHRPDFMTKNGPFTIVFVSSDTVETQKNIVAFLYYMAKFIDKTRALGMRELFDMSGLKKSSAIYDRKFQIDSALRQYYEGYMRWLGEISQKTDLESDYEEFARIREMLHSLEMDTSVEGVIKRIEKALLNYGNDFMKFLEYEDKNYANLSSYEMKEFRQIIDGLYFLSTSETGKTKGQLMEEFLESDIRKERAGYHYQLFALGDNYSQDGEMLLKAYLYGGTGLIRVGSTETTYRESVELKRKLAEVNINLSSMPHVNSIAEFYSLIMKHLAMIREREIIEAMKSANSDIEGARVLESSNIPYHLIKVRD